MIDQLVWPKLAFIQAPIIRERSTFITRTQHRKWCTYSEQPLPKNHIQNSRTPVILILFYQHGKEIVECLSQSGAICVRRWIVSCGRISSMSWDTWYCMYMLYLWYWHILCLVVIAKSSSFLLPLQKKFKPHPWWTRKMRTFIPRVPDLFPGPCFNIRVFAVIPRAFAFFEANPRVFAAILRAPDAILRIPVQFYGPLTSHPMDDRQICWTPSCTPRTSSTLAFTVCKKVAAASSLSERVISTARRKNMSTALFHECQR